jgi:SnoaL-like domain
MVPPADSVSGQTTPARILDAYYRAFSSLDVHAVLPYFSEPAMIIGPQGVLVVPDASAVAGAFLPLMERLRSSGFGHSKLTVQSVRSLDESTTIITGVATRYNIAGEEFEKTGVTYILHTADSSWKIAVLILHDVEGEQPRAAV